MLFNSLTFVVFFAIVLALHHGPFSWRQKKIHLLLASYLFYAAWNPPFVVLLWISTFVDWHIARKIFSETGQGRRRLLLFVSVVVNLGILGYFKYGGFLLANFTALVQSLGLAYEPPAWSIVLPVGISFYTFQTMAYSLDAYLRRAEPAKSLLDFSLFVTFFPQLVAGPIVRPTELIPQFESPHRADRSQLYWGLTLMILGLFEKVVVADGALAPAADAVFGADKALAFGDAWLGTLAFSGQIFCDFAGYSTTAIGASLCLGFSLPDNFKFPYAAIGFSDFWQRWHISLSTWLRDYLYVPLGGNRKGAARTYANLLITMLLGGLWHGASWTFVAWGGLHALYLMAERRLSEMLGTPRMARTTAFRVGQALLTYFLVNVTWVFFRAGDFPAAWRMIRSMFALNDGGEKVLGSALIAQVVVTIGLMLVVHWKMRDRSLEQVVALTPWWIVAPVAATMWVAVLVTQGSGNAFIYFQF